jgi:hypothetical protein
MRRSTQRLSSSRFALVALSIAGSTAFAACGNSGSSGRIGPTPAPGPPFSEVGTGVEVDGGGSVTSNGPVSPAPEFGAIVQAATPPPALGAASIALSHDALTAIASDTDRDRLVLVDLAAAAVRQTIAFSPGAHPGRFAEDAAGNVHVVLRGTGSIATIALATGAIVATRPACGEPRGIAYRASDDSIVVACMTGTVVALTADPSNATPLYRSTIPNGLRDVIVQNDVVYVSTFRDATLIRLDQSGLPVTTVSAQIVAEGRKFEPRVAWRALPTNTGTVLMVHQGATVDAVDVTSPGGYGGNGCTPPIVAAFATTFNGPSAIPGPNIPHGVLPIDAAITSASDRIAVIAAGNNHTPTVANLIWVQNESSVIAPDDPIPSPPTDVDAGTGTGTGTGTGSLDASSGGLSLPVDDDAGVSGNCSGEAINGVHLDGEPVAITLDSSDLPIVLTREPSQILRQNAAGNWTTIALGGGSVEDTGHAIFHSNSGGDLACASCHAEALDDGHTWNFNTGDEAPALRRTQTFRGGFLSTAPFHWDGSQTDMPTLVNTVFVGRMSGPPLADGLTNALSSWMNTLPLLQHDTPDAATTAAIARGKATFENPAVGCTGCHSGAMMTNNLTLDVGTGGEFQVPSLLGVSFRAPYLHDGTAPTLTDRFNPSLGGGDQHGTTSALSTAQIADLVAYLGSL